MRERKKPATRQALSSTALRLVVERGWDNVLVEDIAATANVSPRTFNNYFSSKSEAISAVGIDRARRIGTALRERPARETLWDAVTNAVLQHYDMAYVTPDPTWMTGLRLMLRSPALQGDYLKVNAAMQRELAEAIADRAGLDMNRDMLPMILAGAVTATSQVALRWWLDADPPVPLRPLLQRALRQLASAFPAAPAPASGAPGE